MIENNCFGERKAESVEKTVTEDVGNVSLGDRGTGNVEKASLERAFALPLAIENDFLVRDGCWLE
jgi:hypothetical protein